LDTAISWYGKWRGGMIDIFIQENLFYKLFDIAFEISIIVCIGYVVGAFCAWLGDIVEGKWTPKF
jgi:hypothetical protein